MFWLEVLRDPRAFFERLASREPQGLVPALLTLLVVLLPNLILTVAGLQKPGFLLTSLVLGWCFFAAMLAFTALLAGRLGLLRGLEVAGYSAVPFLLAMPPFAVLLLLGNVGLLLGQSLALAALVMGWYRLWLGLEVFTGSRALAWRGALLGPPLALGFTGFVPGLLLRWLGLN